MNAQDKSIALLSYVKELIKQRTECVIGIDAQIWYRYLDELPIYESEWIQCFYPLSEKERYTDDGNRILFKFTNAQFESCPLPSEELQKWLLPEWYSYRKEADIKDRLPIEKSTVDIVEELEDTEETKYIFLKDSPEIKVEFEKWVEERKVWQARQQRIFVVRNAFDELYRQYAAVANAGAQPIELIIGQGTFLTYQNDGTYNHPVLLKRAALLFDGTNNTLFLIDSVFASEMYTAFLQRIQTANQSALKDLTKLFETQEYHPYEAQEAYPFLKSLANTMNPNTIFVDWKPDTGKISAGNNITLIMRPVLFIRKRTNDMIGTVEAIIHEIKDGAEPPDAIGSITGSGKASIIPEVTDHTMSSKREMFLDEADILLTKESNEEQVRIIEQLQYEPGVLVQGPPGTGKTHTIANILGHFLSQGMRVLVTSQRTKALEVLKEKLPNDLQPLCLSVTDDTSIDMEKSVSSIVDKLAQVDILNCQKEADSLYQKRKTTLFKLNCIRQKIRILKNKEYETIPYQGEALLPYEIGKLINESHELLAFIPGKIAPNTSFPLTVEELDQLYMTNLQLSADEEENLAKNLPSPEQLIDPYLFEKNLTALETLKAVWYASLQDMPSCFDVHITHWYKATGIKSKDYERNITELNENLTHRRELHDWMIQTIIQIQKGEVYRAEWQIFIDTISAAIAAEEKWFVYSSVKVDDTEISCNWEKRIEILKQIDQHLQEKGKFGFFVSGEWKQLLKQLSVQNSSIDTQEKCKTALCWAHYQQTLLQLEGQWSKLLVSKGIALPCREQIIVAGFELLDKIKYCLSYIQDYYPSICQKVVDCGYSQTLYQVPSVITVETLRETENTIGYLRRFSDAGIAYWKYARLKDEICIMNEALLNGAKAPLCISLDDAIAGQNATLYRTVYENIQDTYSKKDIYALRCKLLEKLSLSAPEWADAVNSRIIPHDGSMPGNMIKAWRCKHFEYILDDLYSQSIEELVVDEEQMSKLVLRQTEQLACASAWTKVLDRISNASVVNKALVQWGQAIKKIGKGAGKSAAQWRRTAQNYLKDCATAIPAWVMPIYKIPETLSPEVAGFDVVIIDEASQSDVTAIPVLYLAKKIIVVGDDEQVSPSAIGMNQSAVNALINQYIKDVIPGAELFEPKSSLYDIAKSSFKPLRLREHFRCVPDIIGYSNMLSYDGTIVPLRDAGSTPLQPAVIAYRTDGIREGKHNITEAETIVKLVEACIAQPEYTSKTFGVITLLGDEQAELIGNMLLERLGAQEYENRMILCGNPYHFQGDERDVIFLTMVDSAGDKKPLKLTQEGANNSIKQRYNVSVSRARDQLWVVHSLNKSTDLQENDIRYKLIDYAENPRAYNKKIEQIKELSDSPFEASVASSLVGEGYHITQQYPVGSFKIDIVVHCGKKKIAIECDGEKYHSGEAFDRDSMRQSILERLGWRFIRIRGGEYYRNPAKTMERIYYLLEKYDVNREKQETNILQQESTLLWRIKNQLSNELTDIREKAEIMPVRLVISEDANSIKADSIVKHEQHPKSTVQRLLESRLLEDVTGLTQDTNKRKPVVNIEFPTKKTVGNEISMFQTELPGVRTPTSIAGSQKEVIITVTQLLNALKKCQAVYIDNSKETGIIWVAYSTDIEEYIHQLQMEFTCKLERRGAKATNNKPAWRIMIER